MAASPANLLLGWSKRREKLEFPEVLSSVVGAAVTLSGFAAAFKAFSGDYDPDGRSRTRLNIVIEGGLVIAGVCFLPFVLASLYVPTDLPWRCGSAIVISWSAIRGLWPAAKIIFSPEPLPVLLPLALFFSLCAFVAGALNVLMVTELPAYNLFLVGVILYFFNIGTIFVAQFHAEQREE